MSVMIDGFVTARIESYSGPRIVHCIKHYPMEKLANESGGVRLAIENYDGTRRAYRAVREEICSYLEDAAEDSFNTAMVVSDIMIDDFDVRHVNGE